jgi:hypothetical protein
MLKLPEGPKKVVSGPLVHGSPGALPGPGKCGEYRLSSDPAFSRGAKKGGGEEIGQGHSRSLRSHYLLENVYAGKNRFANFFWAMLICHVALPCCRNKMHSKHWQMLKYVEMF